MRALAPGDAPALFVAVEENRAYLKQWLPWLDLVRSEEDAFNFINNAEAGLENQTEINLGLWWHKASEEQVLVGVVGISSWNRLNRTASIGYWLGQAYQGHGIILQSCKTLCQYCFDNLEINRIELRCAVDNHRSETIAKKLGFTFEGISRQSEYLYDRFIDNKVYALLNDDGVGK